MAYLVNIAIISIYLSSIYLSIYHLIYLTMPGDTWQTEKSLLLHFKYASLSLWSTRKVNFLPVFSATFRLWKPPFKKPFSKYLKYSKTDILNDILIPLQ